MCRSLCALWLCWLLFACGEAEPSVCRDIDGDGYGSGCARGPDCDDGDARRSTDCSDAGPLPDCEAEPFAPGCPCLRGERAACFPGPPEREGVGLCLAGKARCDEGVWSSCVDPVLPATERCNSVDDDCDGYVDEGVESPCGGCDSTCLGGVWGSAAAPFEVELPLELTAAGELSLHWQPYAAHTLWVANTDEGSVSKIDTTSARELARYRTRGGYPIQVAVDHRGDAWVLDGTFGGRAHLTKIASGVDRCRDRDADGVLTSRGPEELLPLGADECVLVDLPLSAADDPRTLAVDGAPAPDSQRAGNVWLGCVGTHQLLHLDGETAAELGRYELSELRPSASAFDAFGSLWLIEREGRLQRFDPARGEAASPVLVPDPCYALDALSIDAEARLLLSGFGCERVYRYDSVRKSWLNTKVPGLLSPRGVLAGVVGQWVAYNSGQLARIDDRSFVPDMALSLSLEDVEPFETFALSLDADGRLWAVSTQGGPQGVGLATRFDPEAGEVTAQVPVGVGPRAGGDLSGSASGGQYAPQGEVSHVFGGCGREAREAQDVSLAQTEWQRLRVVALMGVGASVTVSIRHGEDEDALARAAYEVLGELPTDEPVFELRLPEGGMIEASLQLRSDHALGAPRVARVGVEWACPGPD